LLLNTVLIFTTVDVQREYGRIKILRLSCSEVVSAAVCYHNCEISDLPNTGVLTERRRMKCVDQMLSHEHFSLLVLYELILM